jgi:hypothetical protein
VGDAGHDYYNPKKRKKIRKELDAFWGSNKKAAKAGKQRHKKDLKGIKAGQRAAGKSACLLTLLKGL